MAAIKLYSYEVVYPDSEGKRHYRVCDPDDNRIATCYVEDNAMLIVAALCFLKCAQDAESLPSYKCPHCGRVSYNVNDIRERYCGACHKFDYTGR